MAKWLTGLAGAAAAAALGLGLGPSKAAQPSMTREQVFALFAAAGFPLGADKHPMNRCRQPANPKVNFFDMNGDGRLEALFIDEGPCYNPDGRWYAVAAEAPDGAWRRILEGEGSVHATGAASGGWFVLAATSGGQTKALHYDGHVYASAGGAPAVAAADPAPQAAAAPAAGAEPSPQAAAAEKPSSEPSAKGGRYPTDGWKAPLKFAQLAPAEQASILTAGGFQRAGSAWKGCEGSSSVDKDGVEIRDLNGDGRPEAIITDSSTDCYGMAGQGFTIVRAVPGGWKRMAQETGIPMFLDARGAEGYPDIEVGGPGTCFPVERWNGHSYRLAGARYDDGGKGKGKPCKL